MRLADILAELPKLTDVERLEVFQRLCELREKDLLCRQVPGAAEKALLDQALSDYQRDGDFGRPWRDVLEEIRASAIQWLDDGELSDADRALLDAELEKYRSNPSEGSTWEEVKARIRAKLQ